MLNDAKIHAAKLRGTADKLTDSHRLCLLGQAERLEAMEVEPHLRRQAKKMPLGIHPIASLVDARAKRDAARAVFDEGRDSMAARKLAIEANVAGGRIADEKAGLAIDSTPTRPDHTATAPRS